MPQLTRRSVIIGGAGIAGLAVAGVTVADLVSPASPSATIASTNKDLVRSRYSPLVGESFTATADDTTFGLRLDSVSDLEPIGIDADERRFGLLFSAEAEEPPGGIYTIAHPGGTESVLFISPVGAEGADRRLQAIVDRSV